MSQICKFAAAQNKIKILFVLERYMQSDTKEQKLNQSQCEQAQGMLSTDSVLSTLFLEPERERRGRGEREKLDE